MSYVCLLIWLLAYLDGLVSQNILRKYFTGETSAICFDEPVVEETANFLDDDLERSAVIRTSRDDLAKLLFSDNIEGYPNFYHNHTCTVDKLVRKITSNLY